MRSSGDANMMQRQPDGAAGRLAGHGAGQGRACGPARLAAVCGGLLPVLALLSGGVPALAVPNDPTPPPDLAEYSAEGDDVIGKSDTAIDTFITTRNLRLLRILTMRNRQTRNPAAGHGEAGGMEAAVMPVGSWQREGLSGVEITPTSASLSAAGWTLWTAGEYSRLKDVRTAYRKRGHAAGVTASLERNLNDWLVAGVSFNYTHTRQTTYFNGGRSRINGLMLTPYLSITPVQWMNLTVSGGYVYNRERLAWLSGGSLVSGRRHSNGYTVAALAEVSHWQGNLLLTARTGLAASKDSWKAFVDSFGVTQPAMRERVVQWTVETGAALWLDPVMPYLNVGYTRDLKKASQETDRDEFTIGGGLSWYGSGAYQNVSADVSGMVVLGRKSQRNYTFTLGLRISF